jgi:PKD repeat protein
MYIFLKLLNDKIMKSEFYFGKKLTMILIVLFSFLTVQFTVAQNWCIPTVTNYANYNVGVTNMTFWNGNVFTSGTPSINNTTVAGNGVAPSYNDYTSMVVSGLPTQWIKFSITVTPPGNGTQAIIFVDWNNDGTFNTSGNERAYAPGNLNTAPYTRTDSFQVPSGLVCGPRRVRVAADISFNTPQPCLSGYGEFEDYTLSVLHTGTATLDVAMNKVELPAQWQSGNNNFQISFKSVGSTTINTVDIGYKLDNATPVTVTGYNISGGMSGCQTQIKTYTFASPLNLTTGAHTLKIWVNNPNGTYPDANTPNDSLKISLYTALSGTYVIDQSGSGNFTTFKQATDALKSGGLAGPVLIRVNAGTYNEQVTLSSIAGVSATNTITFDGGDGNASSRIIQFTATTNALSHVFMVNNCQYVTIKNLKMVCNGTSYGTGIHLYGICNYAKIRKNIITYGTSGYSSSSQNFQGISVVNTLTPSSIGQCGSSNAATFDITIDSNRIDGGGYGIQVTTNGTNAGGVSGLQIINNNLTNFYYGIIHSSNRGSSINYNLLVGRSSGSQHGIYGCNGSTSGNQYYEYMGNQIYNVNGYGIGVSTMNPNGTPRNKIINNLVSKNSSGWAIYFPYEKNYDCWHNSIYTSGSTNTSSGGIYICQSTSSGNWSIRNNNIALMNTGSLGYCVSTVVSVAYPTNMQLVEWNNYYKANPANQAIFNNGGIIYSISDIKGASGMNNIFMNLPPNFISASDLHYDSTKVPIYADPTLGITIDVDKEARCAEAPTVGADESKYKAPKPNTNFTAPDTIYKKNIADFLNPSSASLPFVHKWYLNGALRATTLNWSYTFATSGNYKVKLVSYAYCGAIDSTEKTVVVIDPVKAPVADFLSNTNFARTIDNVYLYDQSLNGPSQWKWSISPSSIFDPTTGVNEATFRFMNGTNSSSQNPIIVLKYTGQYTICLKATNNFGSDSICKQDFIVVRTAINICSQNVTNSNYGVLYDDGGPTANYTNNKNCSFLITPCSPNLSLTLKTFNLSSGDYLRIFDGVDNTGTKLYNTQLFPNGFTGDMSVTPSIPTTITSSTGTIYMEYVTDGTTVTTGFEIEWDGAPKVVSTPDASFVMSDTIVCKGRPITFTNTSTGYGNKYYWDMDGDGVIDFTSVHVKYSFMGAGTQEVSLIVENCGGIDTFRKLITIYSPTVKPTVEFEADILNPGVSSDIVTFMDKSQICADQWQWSFTPASVTYRNFTTANSMNPQISFNATGCYTVKLVASCNGNKDSITKTCYINVLNYCIPVVSTFSRDIGISKVSLGTINNTSDITNTGYTNYSKTQATNMFITFPYTITVERLTSFNNISIYVWIDLNNDGDFFDLDEKMAYTNSNAGLTWSAKFYIPATATEGKTRMRIGTNFENLPNLPCGANLYGEFEDYKVDLQKDHEKPVITLIGASSIKVEQGTPYSDPGVIVTDNMDTNISSKIITVNPVNTAVIDTYYVTYDVTDASGNIANQVIRQVIVTEDITVPEITFVGADTMYIEVFSAWVEPGYTSIDKPWGTNLTSSVVVTGSVDTAIVGKYILTYKSTDAYSNTSTRERVVYVLDSQLPIITLSGINPSSVEVYHKYVDPGYVVTDNYCAPSTLIPSVSGNLDTSMLGTYNFVYNLTDCNGNGPVSVQRTVIVYDSTKPVIAFNPGQDVMNVEVFSQYADPGVTVTDNYYPNLIPVIIGTFYTEFPLGVPNKLGTYTIIYSATDGSSNIGTLTRTINVVDTKAPEIKLIGDELVYVEACQWPNYVDEGYTVSDNYYAVGSITIDTVEKFTNSMDTGELYKMQYKATDGSGNYSLSNVRYILVRGISGIEKNLEKYISVYPNPTEGPVTIDISLPSTENLTVKLYDMTGKEQLNIFQGNMQSNKINLDLTNQAKGVYFVRISYNNLTYNKMLIIR